MMAYFKNLPTKTWLLLVVPAVAIAFPLLTCLAPAVLHAIVPQAVRSVLNML